MVVHVTGDGPTPRSLFDKLAEAETGSQALPEVGLDAVVRGPEASPLHAFFEGPHVLSANPWAAKGWAFAAQAFLESSRFHLGARAVTSDPHAIELGAMGAVAFHAGPAGLVARAREPRHRFTPPRRILVQLNDRPPEVLDAADLALRVVEMVGVHGLAGGAVEVAGEGLEALGLGERRRMLAMLSATGCLTAVAALDEAPAEAWGRGGGLPLLHEWRTDPDATVDEILVVNARDVASRVMMPEGRLARVDDAADTRLGRVLVGGCVGGDRESLEHAVLSFERRPPSRAVEVFLVPASEGVHERLRTEGVTERAQRAGCPVLAPHQLPPASGLTLTTSACLDRRGLVASLSTLVASAHQGRLAPGRE